MSEIIGYTRCTVHGCKEAAEFKKDKRGKFFMNCSKHGRMMGSTNEAQAEFKTLYESGAVSEKIENVLNGKPESEPEEAETNEDEPPKSSNKTGAVLAIAAIVGVIFGLKKWGLRG